ncbi:hydroxyethylthiazole kinase [Ignavigranum ruoffiae]|uniref:hydroxyethylthiazole kinase n=1 Tax=Ignavigranum ruoffiae TaxID=89093 RepID=UPI0024ADD8A0|nr:hydroxyethylthiazole kinase [Ignavigranum ruoffiae]
MKLTYAQILHQLRQKGPLIHCISNQIASHFQANALLALGCSPIMTDEPQGAAEIAQQAQALLVNLGSPLYGGKLKAIKQSLRVSQDRQTVRVLDPVGIASIPYRYQITKNLLANYKFTAIRANYAEIGRLGEKDLARKGIDSLPTYVSMAQICKDVALKYQTVVIATGPRDYITDGQILYYHDYGHPNLSQITGTGCVASSILAAFLTYEPRVDIAAQAMAFYAWCGQEACLVLDGPGYLESELINQLYHNSQNPQAETLDSIISLETKIL